MFQLQPAMPTINDVMAKNQQFLCEFVDIKRNGWMHYTKALNNLTGNFWAPWLSEADKNVASFADSLKLTIKLK